MLKIENVKDFYTVFFGFSTNKYDNKRHLFKCKHPPNTHKHLMKLLVLIGAVGFLISESSSCFLLGGLRGFGKECAQ